MFFVKIKIPLVAALQPKNANMQSPAHTIPALIKAILVEILPFKAKMIPPMIPPRKEALNEAKTAHKEIIKAQEAT